MDGGGGVKNFNSFRDNEYMLYTGANLKAEMVHGQQRHGSTLAQSQNVEHAQLYVLIIYRADVLLIFKYLLKP